MRGGWDASKFEYVSLTYNVDEGEQLTEEVSVGPEVVVLEVGVDVVQDELLLQSLLPLRDDPQVQVHGESSHLYGHVCTIYS